MASRTRERLIDVARQLFARQGIENTTMNDIASASDRGRRTVYTYFRTKDDIYQAVIEDESKKMLQELDSKVGSESTPGGKLRALIEYRIAVALNHPHGYELWFKSIFSRDTKRDSRVRKLVTDRIYALIDEIVGEGIATGVFDPAQARLLPSMLTLIVRGSDWTSIRENDREPFERWREECIDFIVKAVEVKNHV